MTLEPEESVPDERADGDRRLRSPIHARVKRVLSDAISCGSIPQGAVLLEGHVADILGVTRTPVRQALQALDFEGLVSRFEGRGMLAGPAGVLPSRVTLTAAMLGHGDSAAPVRNAPGWESIYQQVEQDVVHLSVFDRCRINELELARHFNVGRTVARDVLLRLEGLGLIEKDERLRWAVLPLEGERIRHLYELRWLLEPAALRVAALAAPKGEAEAMVHRLRKAMKAYPKVSRAEMDSLEHDLHVAFLAHCRNQPLLDSLQRTRCILTLSKHVLGGAAPMPRRDPFMAEHLAVFQALAGGDIGAAEAALRTHLENSCLKVTQRAELVRSTLARPNVSYIG
ncbi:GntR family transcriptional regulator [Variovorax sp. PAMC 28711]|uniref:GntR family transcriptional regulator n=1 Tax=Variovorax sp. PAMC 28711 TaxID=1795631 RepID=UPI0009E6C935|nr:GntR family transcriptional regulator [Variovorax sp. PAMC 28711]